MRGGLGRGAGRLHSRGEGHPSPHRCSEGLVLGCGGPGSGQGGSPACPSAWSPQRTAGLPVSEGGGCKGRCPLRGTGSGSPCTSSPGFLCAASPGPALPEAGNPKGPPGFSSALQPRAGTHGGAGQAQAPRGLVDVTDRPERGRPARPTEGSRVSAALALVWRRQAARGIAVSGTVTAGWARGMPSPHEPGTPPVPLSYRKARGRCGESAGGAVGRVTHDQCPFVFPEESQAGVSRMAEAVPPALLLPSPVASLPVPSPRSPQHPVGTGVLLHSRSPGCTSLAGGAPPAVGGWGAQGLWLPWARPSAGTRPWQGVRGLTWGPQRPGSDRGRPSGCGLRGRSLRRCCLSGLCFFAFRWGSRRAPSLGRCGALLSSDARGGG